METAALSPGIKQPKRESNHSSFLDIGSSVFSTTAATYADISADGKNRSSKYFVLYDKSNHSSPSKRNVIDNHFCCNLWVHNDGHVLGLYFRLKKRKVSWHKILCISSHPVHYAVSLCCVSKTLITTLALSKYLLSVPKCKTEIWITIS